MNIDIEKLVSDREAFNAFVYTPLSKAQEIMRDRSKNEALASYIYQNLPAGIPDFLANSEKYPAILSRPIASPNNEYTRFLDIVNMLDDFRPIIWEYTKDKFTPNLNGSKRALAKLPVCIGVNKHKVPLTEHIVVTDFNANFGQMLSKVKTFGNTDLVSFHHELLLKAHQPKNLLVVDASAWYAKAGPSAQEYYIHYLRLFLVHGVLFENFLLDEQEKTFTKKIFLPAFIKIYEETGHKPLVVALESTEVEGGEHWVSYSQDFLSQIRAHSKK